MKNLLTTLIISLISCIGALAQNKLIRDFEENYEDRYDMTTVTIDGSLVKFAGWLASFSDEDDDELESFRRLSKGLRKIHIITIDHWNNDRDKDKIDQLEKDLTSQEDYEVILTAREKGETSKVLSKFGKEDELKDVIIIARNQGELTILSLDGKFKLEDLEPLIND